MIEVIIYIIKILFILFFIGYGLTNFFLPEKLRKDSFYLIFWVGVVFSIILSVALSMARIPIVQGKYFIYFLAFLLLIYSLIKKKPLSLFSVDNLIIFILVLISLSFNLYPLIAKMGFPTTISLGNLDPLSYANVSEYLINHSILDDRIFDPYQPHLKAVGDLLYYGFRWGSPLFLGFISDSLSVRSYQIFYVLMVLLHTMTYPLVYILSKNFFKEKNKYLKIIIFLTFAMNSTLLYLLYNGFFAQFLFSGLFILILILFQSYISDKKNYTAFFNKYDFLIALGISSVSSVYSEGMIFVYFPLFIYFVLKIFSKERKNIFLSLLKILLLTIIINPATFGLAIKWSYGIFFLVANTSFIGWEKIRFSTPLEMTGFYNTIYYKNLPIWIDILSAIPVGFILLKGLTVIKKKVLIISYLILFGLFYFLYLFIFRNYYTHLKTVSYMLFLFSTVFSIGLIKTFGFNKNKILSFIFICFMIFLSFRSAKRTMNKLYYHQRSVDKKIISLQDLNLSEKINKPFLTADVFLGEYDLWTRLWQEYFLDKKEIVSRSNFLDIKDAETISVVLSDKSRQAFDNKAIIYKNTIWENQYYQLGVIDPQKIKK